MSLPSTRKQAGRGSDHLGSSNRDLCERRRGSASDLVGGLQGAGGYTASNIPMLSHHDHHKHVEALSKCTESAEFGADIGGKPTFEARLSRYKIASFSSRRWKVSQAVSPLLQVTINCVDTRSVRLESLTARRRARSTRHGRPVDDQQRP